MLVCEGESQWILQTEVRGCQRDAAEHRRSRFSSYSAYIPESISLGKGSSECGNDLSLGTCYALLDAHGWQDLWDTIRLHHCCLHSFKVVLLRCVHPPLPWRRALEVSALGEALWETFNSIWTPLAMATFKLVPGVWWDCTLLQNREIRPSVYIACTA